MNQKRIDKLIPLAFQVLEENTAIQKMFQDERDKKKIKSAYKGYMSSIGPSIIQAGLIKTWTAFSKESKNTNEDKSVTCELIRQLLFKSNYYTDADLQKELDKAIIDRVTNATTHKRLSEEDRILEAIIAYKLVFDTFEKYEEKVR